MRYAVRHISSYDYSLPVTLSQHLTHLKPRETPFQKITKASLTVSPDTPLLSETTDCFGNFIHFFTIQEPHSSLKIVSSFHAETTAPRYPAPETTPAWEDVAAMTAAPTTDDLLSAAQMSAPSCFIRPTKAVRAYAAPLMTPKRPILAAAEELMRRIYGDFTYDPTATGVTTPPDEVLALKRGVCQDFAHLAVACLRSFGLPARYVSGYIRTHKNDGDAMVGGDASHAWFSVFVPGFGWVDLDPTNNMYMGEEHITVGWGRDFDDMSPVKGIMTGGGTHRFAVDVAVLPEA